MPKRLLVIEADDQGHFFVVVDGQTMTVGSTDADMVLEGLHIGRITCEVEVAEEVVLVGGAESAADGATPERQELRAGQKVHIGHSQLRFEAAEAPPPPSLFNDDEVPRLAEEKPAEPAPSLASASSSEAATLKKLVVIDGGDKGRYFTLPVAGLVTIGKSNKHADIALHDLYVARVHCELECKGDCVYVTHVEGKNGSLINGQRITDRRELQMGEVLRVGNSYLRLELFTPEDMNDTAAGPNGDGGTAMLDFDVLEHIEVIEGEPAVTDAGEAVCLPHAPVDELLKLEDQVLGHYHVGPLLGRGQCGLVFRARDTKNNHVVALKVLSPDFPRTDAELQCFVRALKIVPTLHHPHVVTLHGAGKTGPYSWIAREHVEGESLARLIQRLGAANSALDWTLACRVAWQLANALTLCHKHHVIHGNITPRNILIEKGTRATKLADLMLQQALEGSHLHGAIRKKKLLAELPYLAPEQTDSKAAPNHRADIYALGTVVYHLLTGQLPFSGATPAQVLTGIREGKFARPISVQRGIPASFDEIVVKMMACRPEDRFQSADELLGCLEPIANAAL